MATKKVELNHAECVDRNLEDWKKIFSLSEKAYGWRVDGYKGKQKLVYIPDWIEGKMVSFIGEKFAGDFAVICSNRIWDKFAKHFPLERNRILSAVEFLRHPELFPEEYSSHMLHYAASSRNREEIVKEIIQEEDEDVLAAYIIAAMITSKSKAFSIKTLDKLSEESLTAEKFRLFIEDWKQFKRKEDIINLPWFDHFSVLQIDAFISLAQENNSVFLLAWLLDYKNSHFEGNDPMTKFFEFS